MWTEKNKILRPPNPRACVSGILQWQRWIFVWSILFRPPENKYFSENLYSQNYPLSLCFKSSFFSFAEYVAFMLDIVAQSSSFHHTAHIWWLDLGICAIGLLHISMFSWQKPSPLPSFKLKYMLLYIAINMHFWLLVHAKRQSHTVNCSSPFDSFYFLLDCISNI